MDLVEWMLDKITAAVFHRVRNQSADETAQARTKWTGAQLHHCRPWVVFPGLSQPASLCIGYCTKLDIRIHCLVHIRPTDVSCVFPDKTTCIYHSYQLGKLRAFSFPSAFAWLAVLVSNSREIHPSLALRVALPRRGVGRNASAESCRRNLLVITDEDQPNTCRKASIQRTRPHDPGKQSHCIPHKLLR